MISARFIPARVVGPVEFAGDADAVVSGPRKPLSPRKRQIRAKLRKAFRLKRRINHVRIRKPLGWKGALVGLKKELRVVMVDLRQLGWKPKKPRRAARPGEDEMDAALDELPEKEPGENDGEDLEELPEAPEDISEGDIGNWLDGYIGVERAPAAAPSKKPKKNLWEEAGKLFRPGWSTPVPLGEGARIQTKSGQRAMVATVSPGLFIVQIVSDAAAKKIAGDNVGILPLVLFPLVKKQVQQALAPKAAPGAQPAPAAAPAPAPAQPAPAVSGVGCDCQKRS